MMQAEDVRVVRELVPEEKLLWSGRPRRGFMFHPVSILLIVSILFVVGLVGGLLALNGITHAIRVIEIVTEAARQKFTIKGLFSGLLVLLGLIAIWGFIFFPLERRKTSYALTDRRAIVIPGLFRRKARSLQLSSLNFTALTRQTGHKATVLFGAYPAHYAGMEAAQKQKVMDVWKWFGYQFDRFEIGWASGGRGDAAGRPVFGRFECIEDAGSVYDVLRPAADIRQVEPGSDAEVARPPVGPLVEGVVKRPGIITFLIDVSGSMEHGKLDGAKQGLTGALSMSENNRVGLLAFDSMVTVMSPVAPLGQNRHHLADAVQHLKVGSSTALYDALKAGIEMTDAAEGGEGEMRAVVILTDGNSNAGKARLDDIIKMKSHLGSAVRHPSAWSDRLTDAEGREIDERDVRGCGLAIKTRCPVQIFFIGIGNDADMEIGRMLAEATGAGVEKVVELQSGARVEQVRRVKEVDLARVLEEFRYF